MVRWISTISARKSPSGIGQGKTGPGSLTSQKWRAQPAVYIASAPVRTQTEWLAPTRNFCQLGRRMKSTARQTPIRPNAARPVILIPGASPASRPAHKASRVRRIRSSHPSAARKQLSEPKIESRSRPSRVISRVWTSNALSSASANPPRKAAIGEAPNWIRKQNSTSGRSVPAIAGTSRSRAGETSVISVPSCLKS